MRELLPLITGISMGLGLAFVRSLQLQASLLPALCIPAGALMSLVNGELGSQVWPLFVSFDAILVWLGAGVVLGAISARRRLA
jgi:hypothetical protein